MACQFIKMNFREKKKSPDPRKKMFFLWFAENFFLKSQILWRNSMGINNNETNNFITCIVHLFRRIRKVINKILIYNNGFLNELELISCVFVFFRVIWVNMVRMSQDFTLFVLCCAAFFFFLVQVSLNSSTISS